MKKDKPFEKRAVVELGRTPCACTGNASEVVVDGEAMTKKAADELRKKKEREDRVSKLS